MILEDTPETKADGDIGDISFMSDIFTGLGFDDESTEGVSWASTRA